MAEVFLAMQEGIGGFEKLVVVKRIFKQFCDDDHFVRMFLDEARLAASIRHQNVVQINDIGRDDEGFFIVMEYLSGESLAYIFEALRARGEVIAPSILCRVGASIAAGLHYAHTAEDAAGKPQPIVHRDVTPSNLIVCFNGVVKVVDFGVAKATMQEGTTKAGALKGKMSYLAPEQVNDKDVDGRTDVFQLGIVLWEMLTGKRLFYGDSDHKKMMAVMERRIPAPSEIVPKVPRILDDCVLSALQRDPDLRPQSADTLRRDLESVLKELGSVVSDHDVAEWMQITFAERRAERAQLERECVTQMRSGKLVELSNTTSPPTGHGAQQTPTLATVLSRPPRADTSAGSAGKAWLFGAALLFFVGIVSVVAMQASDVTRTAAAPVELRAPPREVERVAPDPPVQMPTRTTTDPKPVETYDVELTAIPDFAVIEINGEEVGTGSYTASLSKNGTSYRVVVSAQGYKTKRFTFVDRAPKTERIELSRKRGSRVRPRDRNKNNDRTKPNNPDSDSKNVVKDPKKPDKPPKDDFKLKSDNKDPWKD